MRCRSSIARGVPDADFEVAASLCRLAFQGSLLGQSKSTATWSGAWPAPNLYKLMSRDEHDCGIAQYCNVGSQICKTML
jgi:hypothetical protein